MIATLPPFRAPGSQVRPAREEARRRALEVRYGAHPKEFRPGTCEGRVYDPGPEVPLDDLIRIAGSLHR